MIEPTYRYRAVVIPSGMIYHAPPYPWGTPNLSMGWMHPEGDDCGVCHVAWLKPAVPEWKIPTPGLGCCGSLGEKKGPMGPAGYVVGGTAPWEGLDRGEDPVITRQRMKIEDLEVKLRGAEERAKACLAAKDFWLDRYQKAYSLLTGFPPRV